MKKLLSLLLLFITATTHAQEKAAYQEISKAILRAHYPPEMNSKNVISLFAVQVVFGNDGAIDTIYTSKYTPTAMVAELKDKSAYRNINWKVLFKREAAKGDRAIIPVTYYNEAASNINFSAYHSNELFNFGEDVLHYNDCMLLKTVVVHYSTSVRSVK